MLIFLREIWNYIYLGLRQLRNDERGYTSESVVVTAGLVALALLVLAILVKAVTDEAHSIHF